MYACVCGHVCACVRLTATAKMVKTFPRHSETVRLASAIHWGLWLGVRVCVGVPDSVYMCRRDACTRV